jgi:hypothetical protein
VCVWSVSFHRDRRKINTTLSWFLLSLLVLLSLACSGCDYMCRRCLKKAAVSATSVGFSYFTERVNFADD